MKTDRQKFHLGAFAKSEDAPLMASIILEGRKVTSLLGDDESPGSDPTGSSIKAWDKMSSAE